MKPTVRQVDDGEWRVWIDTGSRDSHGRPVFRGDVLSDGQEGTRIDEGPSAPASWTKGFEVVDSPGIPCEVEGAVGVDQVLEIVDSEEELEGPAPADFARLAGSLEVAARAAVRATKKSIRRRIDTLAREAASSSFRGVAILGTDRPFEKEAE